MSVIARATVTSAFTPHFRSFQLKTSCFFHSLPFFHNAAVCPRCRFLFLFFSSLTCSYSYSVLVAFLPVSVHPRIAADPAPKTPAAAIIQGAQALCPVQYPSSCLQNVSLELCLTESQTTATKSKWRGFLQFLGRATLITLLGSAGLFYYVTYRERHPGPQLPPDPKKKTIVVLGSGWGATSLLNTIDTAEYNVVSIQSVASF